MSVYRLNMFKKFLLEKYLTVRLLLYKEKHGELDFFEKINGVRKILLILPLDRAEEVVARKYLPALRKAFPRVPISTFDVFSLKPTDVNWFGMPNGFFLSKMRDAKYDLVLDLNSYHETLCSFVCAATEAPMRLHIMPGKFDKIYNLHLRMKTGATIPSRLGNLVTNLSKIRHVEPSLLPIV